jgi:hypothetical protein
MPCNDASSQLHDTMAWQRQGRMVKVWSRRACGRLYRGFLVYCIEDLSCDDASAMLFVIVKQASHG